MFNCLVNGKMTVNSKHMNVFFAWNIMLQSLTFYNF